MSIDWNVAAAEAQGLSIHADRERERLAVFIQQEGWTVVPELSDPKKAKALADLIRRGKR